MLPEMLNNFFACFEVERPQEAAAYTPDCRSSSHMVWEHEVKCMLGSVNPSTATGPKRVTQRVLRQCTNHLTKVINTMHDCPRASSHYAFKSATNILLPKNTTILHKVIILHSLKTTD